MAEAEMHVARKFRSWSAVSVVALSMCTAATAWAVPAQASSTLTGMLYLTAGACSHGSVSGTYIQMILPSGSASGPYMSNSDSTCSKQEYTLLAPGTQGGMRFGAYQPLPSPAFDSAGNARATAITQPAQFEGTGFATSTNPVDPQTHTKVAPPSLTVHGGKVSADVRSFAVSWNNQYFNQGSPKPDGSDPGITRAATGTYDASTGAMTLNWTSQVVGGPFDKFTGSWHLVGRFVPTSGSASSGGGHAGGGVSGNASATAAPSVTASASATAKPGGAADQATAAASPGASSEPAAATATQAAVTSVVTKHTWHVSWWLIVLAIVIALAGFGGLGVLRRSERGDGTPTS